MASSGTLSRGSQVGMFPRPMDLRHRLSGAKDAMVGDVLGNRGLTCVFRGCYVGWCLVRDVVHALGSCGSASEAVERDALSEVSALYEGSALLDVRDLERTSNV